MNPTLSAALEAASLYLVVRRHAKTAMPQWYGVRGHLRRLIHPVRFFQESLTWNGDAAAMAEMLNEVFDKIDLPTPKGVDQEAYIERYAIHLATYGRPPSYDEFKDILYTDLDEQVVN